MRWCVLGVRQTEGALCAQRTSTGVPRSSSPALPGCGGRAAPPPVVWPPPPPAHLPNSPHIHTLSLPSLPSRSVVALPLGQTGAYACGCGVIRVAPVSGADRLRHDERECARRGGGGNFPVPENRRVQDQVMCHHSPLGTTLDDRTIAFDGSYKRALKALYRGRFCVQIDA